MKMPPIIVLFLAALLATACITPDETPEGHDPNAAAMGHEHEGPAQAVQLDNGQAWSANPETTHGINSMLALVEGYDPASGEGAILKEGLIAEFNDMVAKCTMTGKAHEQLHNYLAPLQVMLNKLGSKPTAADLSELSAYLGTYGKYFK